MRLTRNKNLVFKFLVCVCVFGKVDNCIMYVVVYSCQAA